MPASDEHGVPRPIFEHPWAVRFTHWANAVAVIVLAMSGIQIFMAFPSFGPKIPQENVIESIPQAIALGGWLAGGLQWHFTFMWVFAGAGLLYVLSQAISGHYRTVLFTPRDAPGVWPMARHYFLFGPKPPAAGQYNPLQKLAYTITLIFGALSLLTGLVMYKPVQFSTLGLLLGGYHTARLIHFIAMCGMVAFVPGHLVMVALHGWDNFAAMVTGWKRRPEYSAADERITAA
jgi:Ni/Fe-hydrogenase b-type cytochrome subunit